MKTYILQLTVYLLSVACISASGETRVAARYTNVEVTGGESGYVFNFKSNMENNLNEISIKWNDVESKCSEKDFGKLENVYLRGVQLTTNRPFDSLGPLNDIVLTIPYYHQEVEVNNEKWLVINIIRLHFTKGKLGMWEKAEYDSNKPMNWKFTTWDAENGIQNNGEKESKNNPYSLFIINKESPW